MIGEREVIIRVGKLEEGNEGFKRHIVSHTISLIYFAAKFTLSDYCYCLPVTGNPQNPSLFLIPALQLPP